ncbi:MAG: hypothetical protein WCG04_04220, partial [Alphaproteobacteria bacterium]
MWLLLFFGWCIPGYCAGDASINTDLAMSLLVPGKDQVNLTGVDLYVISEPQEYVGEDGGRRDAESDTKDCGDLSRLVSGGNTSDTYAPYADSDDDTNEQQTLILYHKHKPQRPSQNALEAVNDVSLIEFMNKTDRLLHDKFIGCEAYRRNGAIVGAFFGLVPIVPTTGVLRKTTRDLLLLPKSTTLGNVAIGITVVSLILPYMGQFAEYGKGIMGCSSCCLYSSGYASKEKAELLFPISKAHRLAKVLMGMAVCVNSLTRVVQMAQIEKVFEFVAGTGPFYFSGDFGLNFSNGSREIDKFFYDKVYPQDPVIKLIKGFLKARIRAMKRALASCQDDAAINERYECLMENKMVGTTHYPWKLSWMLMKRANEETFNSGSDTRWSNLDQDMQVFGQISYRKRTADAFAKGLIFLGTLGRFEIVTYGTDFALLWCGLDSGTASTIARGAAGMATVGEAFWESNLHHTLMRHVFRCAEEATSPDNTATKFATTVLPAIGASLFA